MERIDRPRFSIRVLLSFTLVNDNKILSCTISTLFVFFIAENGGKTIKADRGCASPEAMSPFDSCTPTWYSLALEFSAIFLPVKI
jgi:hypothetical protein